MEVKKEQKLLPYEDEEGLWGFTDENGEIIIAPQFEEVGEFEEGLAWVCDEEGYGYIDKEGRLVIPIKFSYACDFKKGTALVEDENLGISYFIDKTGEKIGKGNYSDISPDFIDDNTVGTLLSGKQILLNRLGRPISNAYDHIEATDDGEHWYFEENGIGGIMNSKGEVIIHPGDYDFEHANFSDGMILVNKDDLYGYVNEEGKLTIPFKYEDAKDFDDGLAIVRLNGKAGFINTTNMALGEIKYDEVYSFQEGRAPVKLNEKWGFINKQGQEVIPLIYDQVYKFNEGLGAVRKGTKWGFIDHEGNEVIPFVFDLVWDFKDGKAKVRKNNREYYIDKPGEEI